MVFGTPTTLRPSSYSFLATPRVSSPPIAIRASTPCCRSPAATFSNPFSTLYGLVREVPRIVPPRGRMPRTCSMPSGPAMPSIGPRQPSRKPTNSWPYSETPLRTTARMTAFRPGQSPPPVSTPIRIVPPGIHSVRQSVASDRQHSTARAPAGRPPEDARAGHRVGRRPAPPRSARGDLGHLAPAGHALDRGAHDRGPGRDHVRHPAHGGAEVSGGHVRLRRALSERLDQREHGRVVHAAVPLEEDVSGLGAGAGGEVGHQ